MEKQITVLKRAEVKKANESYNVVPGDIICIVKGSTGNVYVTTLRRNKQHSCLCPGHTHGHECYHIKNLKKLENARFDAEKAYVMSDALHAKLSSTTPDVIEVPEVIDVVEEVPSVSPVFRKQGDKLVPVYTNMFKRPRKWVTEQIEKQENYREILAQARSIREKRTMDYRSAQTAAFFESLPSRLAGSR